MWLRDLQLLDGRPRSHPDLLSDLDLFAVQVVELYLRGLRRKVRTAITAKVLLKLVPPGRPSSARAVNSEVPVVEWPFDVDALDQAADWSKKRLLLDALHDGLCLAASTSGWDRRPLEDARQLAIDAGLVLNGWLLPRWSWAPNGQLATNFQYEFSGTTVHVWAVLVDRQRTEVGRVPLLRTTPYATVKRLVTQVTWVGSRRLNVRSRAFPATTRYMVRVGPPVTAEPAG